MVPPLGKCPTQAGLHEQQIVYLTACYSAARNSQEPSRCPPKKIAQRNAAISIQGKLHSYAREHMQYAIAQINLRQDFNFDVKQKKADKEEYSL